MFNKSLRNTNMCSSRLGLRNPLKISMILIAFAIVAMNGNFAFSQWKSPAASSFLGAGTSENPYQMETIAHFDTIVKYVNSCGIAAFGGKADVHFKLMNDIDDTVRKIIGNNALKYFQRSFDGNNKKLTLYSLTTFL
jgi:hypothetical protein